MYWSHLRTTSIEFYKYSFDFFVILLLCRLVHCIFVVRHGSKVVFCARGGNISYLITQSGFVEKQRKYVN